MYKFQNPHLLWNSIDKTPEDFVYSTRYQKEREAFLISLFAVGYGLLTSTGSCEVRLVKDKEPIEAELKTSKEILGFQITMAIREGRKIKEERSLKILPYRPVRFEEYVQRIEAIVAKKIKKYGSGRGVNLLIYCNMSYENLNAQAMITRFANLAANFDSIWLIMHTFTETMDGVTSGYAIIKLAPDPSPVFYGFTMEGMGLDKPPRRHGVFV